MLETSNLAHKYTRICSVRKYIFQCLGPLSFADVNIFLEKICVFCPKKYLYAKQQCESCVRDFSVLFSVFVRKKVTINENISLVDSLPESSIRTAPNWPKIRKMTMTLQFCDMTSTSKVFYIFLFLLLSLVTGPSFISISSLVMELCHFSFVRD